MVFSDDHRLEPNDRTQLQTTHRGTTKVCLFAPTSFDGTHTLTVSTRDTPAGDFMDALGDALGLRPTTGTYSIAQTNTTWTGFGIQPFVNALEQPYDHTVLNRSAHHREVAAWTAPTNRFHPDVNRVLVTAVRRTKSELAETLHAHLFTDGIPVAGEIQSAVESIPGTVSAARRWSSEPEDRYITTPGPESCNARSYPVEDTAAGERLMAAINDAAADRVELDNAIQREFWIENPYYERPELLREDFHLHEAVADDNSDGGREMPPENVRYERHLYEHVQSIADLRIRIRAGGHPERRELDIVELQRIRPQPSGQAVITNLNIGVKGEY